MSGELAIDTSSLLAFVRYYSPLDDDGALGSHLKSVHGRDGLHVLSAVHAESERLVGGLIVSRLPYLFMREPLVFAPTAYDQFEWKVDHEWCHEEARMKMIETEGVDYWENVKAGYMAGADFQLITYAKERNVTIVTEETRSTNFRRLFRKIPEICDLEGIKVINLAEMVKVLGIKTRFTPPTATPAGRNVASRRPPA